jgi:hypothetical protein
MGKPYVSTACIPAETLNALHDQIAPEPKDVNYKAMKVADLKVLLGQRGADTKGLKAVLVERLESSDRTEQLAAAQAAKDAADEQANPTAFAYAYKEKMRNANADPGLQINLNHDNKVLSESCLCCRSFSVAEIVAQYDSFVERHGNLTEATECVLRMWGGSDMQAYGEALGRTALGQAVHRCIVCACQKWQMKPGTIHSPVVLPKFRHMNPLKPSWVQNPRLLVAEEQVATGLKYLAALEAHTQDPGKPNPKDKASEDYRGCENVPLLAGEAERWFCSMCLHITLGWTKRLLDSLELLCVQLDRTIIQTFGYGAGSYEANELLSQFLDLVPLIEAAELEQEAARATVDDCARSGLELRNNDDINHVFKVFSIKNKRKREERMEEIMADEEDRAVFQLAEQYEQDGHLAQARVDAAEAELVPLRRKKALLDDKMKIVEGPCMEEFRAVSDACHFQRQKWHGGAPNGPDCIRFLSACQYFVEILKPRFIQPAAAAHFTGNHHCKHEYMHALPARRGKVARAVQGFVNKRRKARAARVPTVAPKPTPMDKSGAPQVSSAAPVRAVAPALLWHWDNTISSYATGGRWFGSEQTATKFRCSIDKFKQLQQLYQPSRPLCKHEVAIHSVRAISYGNWFPCK